ncbi:MAG: hypothetical protein ACI9FB_000073 [Candidatus Azotimanducaceae bacterium]|jgi:hypothetical protein
MAFTIHIVPSSAASSDTLSTDKRDSVLLRRTSHFICVFPRESPWSACSCHIAALSRGFDSLLVQIRIVLIVLAASQRT